MVAVSVVKEWPANYKTKSAGIILTVGLNCSVDSLVIDMERNDGLIPGDCSLILLFLIIRWLLSVMVIRSYS